MPISKESAFFEIIKRQHFKRLLGFYGHSIISKQNLIANSVGT